MTQPPASDAGGPGGHGEHREEPVDLGKAAGSDRPARDSQPHSQEPQQPQSQPEAFDPYRFGKPEQPVPPEFAPPGYAATGYTPTPQPSPYGSQPTYGSPPPYGAPPQGYPPQGAQPPYPGSQPYGPGAPVPPAYHTYPQPRTGNGKATASLVLGILSIVFFWLSLFDGVLIILGLVFGLLGLAESRRIGGGGRSLAIAGLACVAVGAAAAMLWTAMLVHAVDKCGGLDTNDTNSSVFEHCVSDHLWFK